ncbi:MAG: galactose-1-phosphate uridylyltransferase [Candidatus Dormibacteraeota bacterium]|nr:galactose-1-phosphate uridylyltransferase [Candidatus Dormibacteraeota bacterium]
MPRPARTDVVQADGRHVYLYDRFAPAPPGYEAPALGEGAYERRWNPLRQEWVLVAAARQSRTFLPARDACPLDPSTPGHSTEIPAAQFDAAVFENRFPAMVTVSGGGVCEVVVYTDAHDGSFASLPAVALERLIEVWTDRYRALAARADVRYVFIFENRGEQVGVTLHHPHGQIYGYPFIPPVAAAELRGRSASCRQCAVVRDELADRRRLLIRDRGLVAYVPVFARWPYEVHVSTVEHRQSLPDLSVASRRAMVHAMQRVAQAYDRLFSTPMPYMMVIHQQPTDGKTYAQAHLHVEFYPTLRDSGKLKYLAGSESGAGVFINDTLAESSAARLRQVLRA